MSPLEQLENRLGRYRRIGCRIGGTVLGEMPHPRNQIQLEEVASSAVKRFEVAYRPELEDGDVVFTDYTLVADIRR
jgi:hypothetical protein